MSLFAIFATMSQTEKPSKIPPCPISPNITPNKNGNTGIANNVGFIY